MAQLRHAVHEKQHFLAELLLDLIRRHDRVLKHIMKQTCRDRLLIKLQLCQNDRHAQRMHNIRLTGFARLSLMCIPCHMIRLFNKRNICGRVIFAHTGDQLMIQILRTLKLLHWLDTAVLFLYQFFQMLTLKFFFFLRVICHVPHPLHP